jgi:hypothetical protein
VTEFSSFSSTRLNVLCNHEEVKLEKQSRKHSETINPRCLWHFGIFVCLLIQNHVKQSWNSLCQCQTAADIFLKCVFCFSFLHQKNLEIICKYYSRVRFVFHMCGPNVIVLSNCVNVLATIFDSSFYILLLLIVSRIRVWWLLSFGTAFCIFVVLVADSFCRFLWHK